MEILRTHCNKCGGERRHELVHVEKTSWEEIVENQFSIDGWDRYEMVKCCGCDNVSLRHISYFSEDCDEYGNRTTTTHYYPPTISRREPSWLYKLSSKNGYLRALMDEIYISLHNNCPRIATMGIRALIEHTMIDKVGDNSTFAANLEKFESAGFISRIQREVLKPVLEAGHASMHRAFSPEIEDLNSIIDITENIIESIYINECRVRDLQDRVPGRAARTNKGGPNPS